jgi:hypothetical protein
LSFEQSIPSAGLALSGEAVAVFGFKKEPRRARLSRVIGVHEVEGVDGVEGVDDEVERGDDDEAADSVGGRRVALSGEMPIEGEEPDEEEAGAALMARRSFKACTAGVVHLPTCLYVSDLAKRVRAELTWESKRCVEWPRKSGCVSR